jgi:class 3 adenylate cyclase
MPKQRRPYSLRSTLIIAFSVLSLPVLALVLSLSYWRNIESTKELLHDEETRAHATINRIVNVFFRTTATNLEILASLTATEKDFFRAQSSNNVLHSSLLWEQQIGHIYVTYEDGYMRGVSRIDEERRKEHPETPTDAAWHSQLLEPASSSSKLTRHQSFYATWPQSIKDMTEPSSFDGRAFPHYIGAKETKHTFLSEPYTSPTSGSSVVSLAVPILTDGQFIGTVSANITTLTLSHFLSTNRVSPNSIAAIINDKGGIIARPMVDRSAPDHQNARIIELDADVIEDRVADALRSKHLMDGMDGSFTMAIDGVESNVSIFKIPNPLNIPWRAILITPLDDYVAPLRRTAQALINLILLIIPVELFLINALSKRLSSGFVQISRSIDEIRDMNFMDSAEVKKLSGVQEINQIEEGFALLRSALRSFAQYIPLDVVRQLANSGRPLALGVEKRSLTIFFCDLENFSTLAQGLSPEELLRSLSDYFSTATKAISEEGGTVDKFIGDAVMAFWGAPSEIDTPALRACKAALKLHRRLEALNERWRAEGRAPLHVRIGLNSSEALVGNIGSSERLSYTAIGDGVNVASRLEGINKDFGTSLCISDNVLAEVADEVIVRPLKPVSVKGRSGEFMIYELLGIRNTEDRDLQVLKETASARRVG